MTINEENVIKSITLFMTDDSLQPYDWMRFVRLFKTIYFQSESVIPLEILLRKVLNISQKDDINSGVEYTIGEWCMKLYSY